CFTMFFNDVGTGLKMVCQCWLLVVVMAYLCVPGLGSGCLESSICNNLSNKGRILDCVYLCMSVIQTEEPELRTVDSSVVDDDADSDLLLSIILANVAPEDTLDLRARGADNERRSYSMEHFRWGKPPGRKRRPVKVFASSLEGGGSPEVAFPVQVRRQLRADDSDEAREAAQAGSRAGAKSQVPLNLQQRKDGTYRMSHFRWGSPPASKRNGVFARPWEEKPQGLAKIIRNIIVKDVQRIMG
uniref:Proopiomelanocortin b n=1 Tax=Salarias fasciatus TaxID=181472 RepID=A0A672I072_SALFA